MQKMTLAEIEKAVEQYIKENIIKKNEAKIVSTPTGTAQSLTSDQEKEVKAALLKKQVVDIVKPGANIKNPSASTTSSTMEAKKKKEAPAEEPVADSEPPAMDEPPVQDTTASSDEAPSPSNIEELKSKIENIVSTLETMDDFKIGDKQDLKAKKIINKVQAKLDDVLLSMDDLSSLKKGIDEQKEVINQKEGDKFVKHLEKLMKKRFKNSADVKAVMDKYHATARKYKQHQPKKVAEAIVKHMLKEGFNPADKKKDNLNEELLYLDPIPNLSTLITPNIVTKIGKGEDKDKASIDKLVKKFVDQASPLFLASKTTGDVDRAIRKYKRDNNIPDVKKDDPQYSPVHAGLDILQQNLTDVVSANVSSATSQENEIINSLRAAINVTSNSDNPTKYKESLASLFKKAKDKKIDLSSSIKYAKEKLNRSKKPSEYKEALRDAIEAASSRTAEVDPLLKQIKAALKGPEKKTADFTKDKIQSIRGQKDLEKESETMDLRTKDIIKQLASMAASGKLPKLNEPTSK